MKELDLLLEAFVAQQTAALADGAWPEFEPLLSCEDDQLWDWFQGRPVPNEYQQLQPLIKAISG
jgi:succinate dehydrogenase flavin-adding protein (antitoxin of CptAB toxin-antitoxin module)